MIEHYLQTLKNTWAQEPQRHTRSRFYLTPEQRIRILRELLCPLSTRK